MADEEEDTTQICTKNRELKHNRGCKVASCGLRFLDHFIPQSGIYISWGILSFYHIFIPFFCQFKKRMYFCIDSFRHASRRTANQGGTFAFIDL